MGVNLSRCPEVGIECLDEASVVFLGRCVLIFEDLYLWMSHFSVRHKLCLAEIIWLKVLLALTSFGFRRDYQ